MSDMTVSAPYKKTHKGCANIILETDTLNLLIITTTK